MRSPGNTAETKPIPQTLEGWASEFSGISAFLSKRNYYRKHMGEKWWQSNYDYYRAMLIALINHAPKELGLDVQAVATSKAPKYGT